MYIFHVLALLAVCVSAKIINETKQQSPNNNDANETIRQAGYGLVRFEGQAEENHSNKYGLVFHGHDGEFNRPLKFEDAPIVGQNGFNITPGSQNNVLFLDDNNTQNAGQIKKRKRRRRKPKRLPVPQNPSNTPSLYPYSTQQYAATKRPLREAQGPLAAFGSAVASLVENDAKQCVSRMLCEESTGSTFQGSSLFDSVTNLLLYLPLLYKQFSLDTNPIFRTLGTLTTASILGYKTKDIAQCAKKYNECPSDPEERLNYLNNYNGGFTRLFKGPNQHQYTEEEIHNFVNQIHPNSPYYQEQYGLLQPYPSGQYGVYNPSGASAGYQDYTSQYGLQYPSQFNMPTSHNSHTLPPEVNAGFPYYPAYSHPNSIYGSAYPHFKRHATKSTKSDKKEKLNKSEIQQRILNLRGDSDNFHKTLSIFKFPKSDSGNLDRKPKQLAFPENQEKFVYNNIDKGKSVLFPGEQSNRQYSYFELFNDDYVNDDSRLYNLDVEQQDGQDDETVYVVRGNGDPNYPEVIKLRPGEKVQ